jgi:hypothetical protein
VPIAGQAPPRIAAGSCRARNHFEHGRRTSDVRCSASLHRGASLRRTFEPPILEQIAEPIARGTRRTDAPASREIHRARVLRQGRQRVPVELRERVEAFEDALQHAASVEQSRCAARPSSAVGAVRDRRQRRPIARYPMSRR